MTGFGVPVPLAVPIFHLQRLCGAVAFSRHKPFHPDESYYLSLVAPAFHRDFARELRAGLDGRAQLTLREIECLRHASTGMTSEEIAEVMPLAAATVTAQLRSAAAKLGAANRVSAIAEAIRRGVIE
jgi:DNA-binding CsgD family transcriptional regulator